MLEYSFLSTLIGMLFMHIPVFAVIGADGSCLFGIAVDSFMLIYIAFGMSMTYVIRESVNASAVKAQYRCVCNTVRAGILVSTVYSVLVAMLVILAAEPISVYVLDEPRVRMVIYAALPAIIFSLISSAEKGYISGCRVEGIFAAGHYLEAVMLAAFSFLGAKTGLSLGTKASALLVNSDIVFIYGAAGAMAGVSIAELFIVVYWTAMLILFMKPMKKMAEEDITTGGGTISSIMKSILNKQLPYILTGLLITSYFPITMRFFFSAQYGRDGIITSWGEYISIFLPIISICAIICFLSSARRIRSVVKAQRKDEQNKMNKILNSAFRYLIVTGVPISLYITAVGGNISSIIGASDKGAVNGLYGFYSLLILSTAVWLFLSSILFERSYISDIIIGTSVSYLAAVIAASCLINFMHSAAGAVIGMIIFTVMMSIFSSFMIRKNMGMRVRMSSYLLKLLICGAVYLAVEMLLKFILSVYVGDLAAVLVCFVTGWILYLILISYFKVLPDGQICRIPCGEIIVVLMRGSDQTREE